MPTGYTADVGDGKVADFQTFALQCARAFGALVMMRDDDKDAPIPESFAPSTYHDAELVKATEELARLKVMTPAQIAEGYGAARALRQQSDQDERRKREATKDRYETMLSKVRSWRVPTPEHQNLRDFMEAQLVQSIDFDCRDLSGVMGGFPESAEKWRLLQIEHAAWNVEYHRSEGVKEKDRAASRTAWVKALRESLS